MIWKVLSQEIHMWNMKALSLTLLVHKLWPRLNLNFLKSRSNFKVKVTMSKIMVWCKRSYHKKYTCEIWKPCLSRFISYDQGLTNWGVGTLIHPPWDWYFSIWNSILALDYFSHTYVTSFQSHSAYKSYYGPPGVGIQSVPDHQFQIEFPSNG